MKKLQKCKPRVNTPVPVDPIRLASIFAHDNGSRYTSFDLNSKSVKQRLAVSKLGALSMPEFDYYHQLGALFLKRRVSDESLFSLSIDKFKMGEATCAQTNTRVGLDKKLTHCPDLIRTVIERARYIIGTALPPCSDETVSAIIARSRPGSGAAIGVMNRFRVSSQWKMGACVPYSYPRSSNYVTALIWRSPMYQRALEEFGVDTGAQHITDANRVTFVPKDAFSLRTIAIEPAGTMMVQLGVHDLLTSVLKRLNNPIDEEAQAFQQERARVGSITKELSTIDLSAASDSISLACVWQLFPSDWVQFLYTLRAPFGILPSGERLRYEKWASMGNGTTFALETLLFLAVARACGDPDASVYGDDIIIKEECTDLLIETLAWLGFSVNNEKSFRGSSPFRESCGADWYNGVSVRPKYWRLSNKPLLTELYDFLNTLPDRFDWSGVRKYIMECIAASGQKLNFGPPTANTSGWLFAPDAYLRGSNQGRWNRSTQSYEYREILYRPVQDRLGMTPNLALAGLAFGTHISTAPLRGSGRWVYKYTHG